MSNDFFVLLNEYLVCLLTLLKRQNIYTPFIHELSSIGILCALAHTISREIK